MIKVKNWCFNTVIRIHFSNFISLSGTTDFVITIERLFFSFIFLTNPQILLTSSVFIIFLTDFTSPLFSQIYANSKMEKLLSVHDIIKWALSVHLKEFKLYFVLLVPFHWHFYHINQYIFVYVSNKSLWTIHLFHDDLCLSL